MEIKERIILLFNYLENNIKSFVNQTYFHSSNIEFRKYPYCREKVFNLASLYLLDKIEIDFSSIKNNLTNVNDSSKSIVCPVKIFFNINTGSATIQNLICVYNVFENKDGLIFNIENNTIVVYSLINFCIVSKDSLDSYELLKRIIPGGIECIKEIVNEINSNIEGFNKKIFAFSDTLCKNLC